MTTQFYDETLTGHIYHLCLELVVKIESLTKEQRAQLSSRLKQEAVRNPESYDSVAMRCIDNICQAAENDL